jgi:hypothetical protein
VWSSKDPIRKITTVKKDWGHGSSDRVLPNKLQAPSSNSCTDKKKSSHQAWHTSVIPALRKPRQEDREFKAGLGYIKDPVSKSNKLKLEMS